MSERDPATQPPPASQPTPPPASPPGPVPDSLELFLTAPSGDAPSAYFTTTLTPKADETLAQCVGRAMSALQLSLPAGTQPRAFSERSDVELPMGSRMSALYAEGQLHPGEVLSVAWRHTQGARTRPTRAAS